MKTIAMSLVLLTAGLFTSAAQAQDPHIDDLAYTLKAQSAAACKEVYYHFRRTPQFQHLYADLYAIYEQADHIHEVAHHAHHGADYAHLADDVDQIDELFHHTEELFDAMRTSPYGHHNGYHVRRLSSILKMMEDTIHHMQEDLNPAGVPGTITPPIPPSTPVLPAPGAIRPTPSGRVGYGPAIRLGNGKLNVVLSLGR